MGRKAMLLSNCLRGKILKLLCYITLEVIGWRLVLYQNFPKPYFGYSLTNTQVTASIQTEIWRIQLVSDLLHHLQELIFHPEDKLVTQSWGRVFYALANKCKSKTLCSIMWRKGRRSMCKFLNTNYEFIFFFVVFEASTRSAIHFHAYQRTLLKLTC